MMGSSAVHARRPGASHRSDPGVTVAARSPRYANRWLGRQGSRSVGRVACGCRRCVHPRLLDRLGLLGRPWTTATRWRVEMPVSHQQQPFRRERTREPSNRNPEMDSVILTGRLTDDLTLRYTSDGKAFSTVRVAVTGGNDRVDLVKGTVSGKTADSFAEYKANGDQIAVCC